MAGSEGTIIPYDDIIEHADRRWTLALLQRFTEPKLPDAERDDLIAALQEVADPRTFDVLESLVVDRGRTAPLREAASAVLHGLFHGVYEPPPERLRLWWGQGDSLLRRPALKDGRRPQRSPVNCAV